MDACAHLLSLGWAGPGHSLDSRPFLQQKGRRRLAYDPSRDSNTGHGLIKPLLLSQKKNTFGVGKKTHEPAAGNEWWLKGFENALNNIGKRGVSEARSGTATPETPNTAVYTGKHTGLYGFFTKGQEMKGTIDGQKMEMSRGQKRKSDTFDEEKDASTTSGSSTPAQSTAQNRHRSKSDFAVVCEFYDTRDKDRKRIQKRAQAEPAQEFEQVGRFFEARAEPRMKHVKKKPKDLSNAVSDANRVLGEGVTLEGHQATKDQRVRNTFGSSVRSAEWQRVEGRREAKARVKSSSSRQDNDWSSWMHNPPADGSMLKPRPAADDVLRKAERKKRKEQKRLAKMQTRC